MIESGPGPGPAVPAEYPCDGCGARVEYTPGTSSLRCPYCGYERAVTQTDDRIEEHPYDALPVGADKPRSRLGRQVVRCGRCAAQTQSDDLSAACPFCGAPVVADPTADDQIAPEAIVPFGLDASAARDAVRTWVRSRWFAPSRLAKAGTAESLQGTYLPFWTFDAATDSTYTGRRGQHYWQTETFTDAQGRRQTRQVRHTAWSPASGRVFRSFDDVLVPASTVLPPERLEATGPWQVASAVPFHPDYLAGFRTPRYDIEPAPGLARAKELMAGPIEADCRADIGGDEQHVSSVDTAYTEVMIKLVLIPLWIAAYLYGGRSYQVLVNAQTGSVTGQRPYSIVKIAAAVLAALATVGVIALIVSGRG